MKITSVTYRELKSTPGYGHQAIEATAEIRVSESPDLVLEELKSWVKKQLGLSDAIQDAQSKLRELQYAVNLLEERERQAKERWTEIETFMRDHNLQISTLDLPF